MARSVLVDAGFLIALLSRRDRHHRWAAAQPARFPPPWRTCEAALSEAFHLLGSAGIPGLATLLRRGAVLPVFDLDEELEPVLRLIQKYADVPMGLADACLVRMTETLADAVVLTTDADFVVYRRHSRHVVPCVLPAR
jgi:predicted nucleic acid-binding protein